MMTESVSRPVSLDSSVERYTVTRLGWLARNILLVIIEMRVCGARFLISRLALREQAWVWLYAKMSSETILRQNLHGYSWALALS